MVVHRQLVLRSNYPDGIIRPFSADINRIKGWFWAFLPARTSPFAAHSGEGEFSRDIEVKCGLPLSAAKTLTAFNSKSGEQGVERN